MSTRVVYCRIPLGCGAFLQIRRYVEIPARAFGSARAVLQEMRVVEVLRGGTVRGPRGGTTPVVRIAVGDDVAPLGSEEFDEAIKQRRILTFDTEHGMGDSSVRFRVVTHAARESTDALCLLFQPPCRLRDAEVSFPLMDGSWGWAGAAIDDFRQYFTRPLAG